MAPFGSRVLAEVELNRERDPLAAEYHNPDIGTREPAGFLELAPGSSTSSAGISFRNNAGDPDLTLFLNKEDSYTWVLVVLWIVVNFLTTYCVWLYWSVFHALAKRLFGIRSASVSESSQQTFLCKSQTYVPSQGLRTLFGETIGQGEFGIVRKFSMYAPGDLGKTYGAAKVVKDMDSHEQTALLSKELEALKAVSPHPHVVELLGYCKSARRVLIMLELCPYPLLKELRMLRGSVDFAQSGSSAHVQALLRRYLIGISSALGYLGAKGVVHRDVACRNILIDRTGEAKLADFGLAIFTEENGVAHRLPGEPLPWRWTALEGLVDGVFSSHSDVWSYAVLAWEMYSFGQVPFPEVGNASELIEALSEGLMPSQPVHCPNEMYRLLYLCFRRIPAFRPTFGFIEGYLQSTGDYTRTGSVPNIGGDDSFGTETSTADRGMITMTCTTAGQPAAGC